MAESRFVTQLRAQVVAAAKSMLGWPYELGGWGLPPDYGIDCRGFAQRSFKLAGARSLIGGYQPNVRAMVRWAKDNGRFRDPDAYPGKRADLIFYNEPSAMPGPVGNPDCIRHVAIKLRNPSAIYPDGLAISALNPRLDVAYHPLNLRGYAIYGYCAPDWASLDVAELPMVDPEPAV